MKATSAAMHMMSTTTAETAAQKRPAGMFPECCLVAVGLGASEVCDALIVPAVCAFTAAQVNTTAPTKPPARLFRDSDGHISAVLIRAGFLPVTMLSSDRTASKRPTKLSFTELAHSKLPLTRPSSPVCGLLLLMRVTRCFADRFFIDRSRSQGRRWKERACAWLTEMMVISEFSSAPVEQADLTYTA